MRSLPITLVLIATFLPAHLADDEDNTFLGDDFYDEFDEWEHEEKIHDRLDKGVASWEKRCLQIGGQEALDNWLKAQENLVYCFMENFDVTKIEVEMKSKKRTGDLDLLFTKYCGDPVSRLRECFKEFLSASRECNRAKDTDRSNITLNMFDSAVEFLCHNSGDRIALFMAEDGFECVQDHKEEMMNCINSSLPQVFHMDTYSDFQFISRRNCKRGYQVQHCIERTLLQCPDPTPSNVVNSMMLAMRSVTPCRRSLRNSPGVKVLSSGGAGVSASAAAIILGSMVVWR